MDSPYLTTEELAERWRCAASTVRKLRWKAEGPAYVKLGDDRNSEVRYHLEDVLAYENSIKYVPR